uniref:MISP family member 3 n=1 Tax=Sphenodon punctatus TaxID=8508 RepID=A0A8D0HGE4_SPHPU
MELTPIEREIRLHLEREETLRRERGLASPRGAQEYVEVRVRPILSHTLPPSPFPKEKERQWAGAQMQREIQREQRREEDLRLRSASANPFGCLRAKSPQSLLELEVREAREREKELQRQRHSLYGAEAPAAGDARGDQEEVLPSRVWQAPPPPREREKERASQM